MEIHVDPLGGWSGDMFAAAMLDAFPEFWLPVEAAVARLDLGPQAACSLVDHRDHALTGRRFLVTAEEQASDHSHGEPHSHHHHHPQGAADHAPAHRAWADIRHLLHQAPLDPPVRDHAIAIFALLAQAEAEVHGVDENEVQFHEVGAIDSIVDIVVAAQLIALIGATRWTSAPLPLGAGRVKTAHGLLPVPAPATALLLRGLLTIDDGIAGERVTPTGAAIARYLLAPQNGSPKAARVLSRTGTGFGTRVLPGISNCLRVLAFDPVGAATITGVFSHRELDVITFEIDDQSAEDLAIGLDHLRAVPGVRDVVQSTVVGKKGRVATRVQLLVAPADLEAAIAACFEETTTIGLRFHRVGGAVLTRSFDEVEAEGQGLRVKKVRRPDGRMTGKTEADDVAPQRGHAARMALRLEAEAIALAQPETAEERGS